MICSYEDNMKIYIYLRYTCIVYSALNSHLEAATYDLDDNTIAQNSNN